MICGFFIAIKQVKKQQITIAYLNTVILKERKFL